MAPRPPEAAPLTVAPGEVSLHPQAGGNTLPPIAIRHKTHLPISNYRWRQMLRKIYNEYRDYDEPVDEDLALDEL